MKYLYLLLFIIIINCADYTLTDDNYWELEGKYNISSIKDIVREAKSINYKYDYENGKVEYYQTPLETEKLKTGDCEDKSIYALSLAYKYLDIKGQLLIVDENGDGIANHVMYRLKNKDHNKSSLNNSYSVKYIIEFDDIPEYARNFR